MMLHAFHIVIDYSPAQAQEFAEIGQQLVATAMPRASVSPSAVRTSPRYFSYFSRPSAPSLCTMLVTLACVMLQARGDIDHPGISLRALISSRMLSEIILHRDRAGAKQSGFMPATSPTST